MSHRSAEAACAAASGRRAGECGCCWIRPDEGALLTAPQVPAAASQHLTSLAQQLHSSLHAHPLTRLLLDDLEVDLDAEQRLQASEAGLTAPRDLTGKGGVRHDTGEVRLQAAKRCDFGDTQYEDTKDEGEGASVAKRLRTEQVF